VIQAAASEARNAMARPMSSGSPIRPRGSESASVCSCSRHSTLGEFGADEAGRDRVDSNCGSEFHGALFGEMNQRGLAGVVNPQVGLGV